MTPDWLDADLYPFTPKQLDLGIGKMSYVDEGEGPTIIMVHGTPSWSFLYRDLITQLSAHYRCIAPDHLGFGLSDKPQEFAYTPEAHAKTLETFIERLGLKNVTLMVHDFGGPIGLSYALKHPENVSALVLMNTWMWRFKTLGQVGSLLANPIGKYLYQNLDLSINVLLKRSGFADPTTLSETIFKHYKKPFPTAKSRAPLFALVNTIAESNAWFETLWERRNLITSKPTLLVWGTQDKLIPLDFLNIWKKELGDVDVLELNTAGHFLQEEAGGEIGSGVKTFLKALAES